MYLELMFHIIPKETWCYFVSTQVAVDSIMAKSIKMFSQICEGVINFATE